MYLLFETEVIAMESPEPPLRTLEVEVRGAALSKAVQTIYDECHRKMQHEPKHKPHVVFISTDIEVDETAKAKALLSALVDEGANVERYVLLDDADMFVNDLGRYILAFSCFVRD